MNLKLMLVLCFFVFFCISCSFAQFSKRSAIVEVDGYAFLSEDKPIKEIREEALTNAKREAMEHADVYIKSVTRVENMKLSYDLIETETEGVVRIIDSNDLGVTSDQRYHYRIKAEISYKINTPVYDNGKVQNHAVDSTVQQVQLVEADTTLIYQQEALGSDRFETVLLENQNAPLTVKVWTNKAEYQAGEEVQIYLKGNKDFYARVVYMDVEKNLIQLVPNLYRKDNYFRARQVYTIPAEDDKFILCVRPPLGNEKILVYASTAQPGKVNTQPIGNSLLKINNSLEETSVYSRSIEIFAKEENVSIQHTPLEAQGKPVKGCDFYEAQWGIQTCK